MCQRKGNQQLLNHALHMLDKFDEASNALKKSKVKVALKPDKLASHSDDEKRIYHAERRAERKLNKDKHWRSHPGEKRSGATTAFPVASSSRYAANDSSSALPAR